MIFKKLKDRYFFTGVIFTLIFAIILLRVATLMIVNGESYREQAENRIIKSIRLPAPRGEIRDRYGRLLAGSRPSYTVQIMKSQVVDEEINNVALKLINIFEANGDQYEDEFPIILDENGKFHFTFDMALDEWKERVDLVGVDTGLEAYQILMERYGLEGNLSNLDGALAVQAELHRQFETVPVSVKTWKFTQEALKEQWFQSYYMQEYDLTAEEAFNRLREKNYRIPEDFSAEEARKIMIIREQLKKKGYLQFQPVKIANDVSWETVVQIEEDIFELPGVNIAVEPIRYYPEGNAAAHILGQLGKISQEHEIEKYINQLDYDPSDIIGKNGVEHKFEDFLKGTDGSQKVVVDSRGRLIDVLEKIDPIPGNTLYLTIDINLQKKAEESMANVLKAIQRGEVYETEWGTNKMMGTAGVMNNATSGSVVVTDVKTGDLLALANYPDYDPNLFATGISSADWQSLHPENERDPLAPRPLLNIALSTAIQPGSTYKMLVGLAAIEEGLDPHYKILDRGFIKIGGHSFGNWLWNQGRGQTMGWQGLHEAIEDSNNYYFYSLGTGYDYGIGRWLPVPLNVNTFIDYSHRFGLNERTGIEIDVPRERSGGVPSIEAKSATIKALLERNLKRLMKPEDFDETVEKPSTEKINEMIDKIISWTAENPGRGDIYLRLKDFGFSEDKASIYADLIKYSYFNQARWSIADTMNFSIGQGEHAYTPIQMTNYMAILANGGHRYRVSLLDKIQDFQGNTILKDEPDLIERIEMKDYKNLDEVNYGMHLVTTTGTARGYFNKFPIKVAGKTGTAQRSGKIPPVDEVAYLKKHMGAFGVSEQAVNYQMEVIKAEDPENPRIHDDVYLMREAIKQLNPRIKNADLDQFKENYDNYAWFTGFAPYENPEIAISVLIFQGGSGGYGAPIFREVVAEYMGLNLKEDGSEMMMQSRLTQ
ncbi:penicillin-binding transpeptidase domain-containing protein [Alkaliphilus hydrothermalis]|uniref:Penicillin-binding protein 2 n=1 Tax=Alkaliphilus hydrothermalis TaxID=1482730 RepID=A0ABS2NL30_9FIRM|nr:penicillin-binding transpeptidase domain-containing protein [Alkaliphilus hydrothermalis]MBM7613581.1 penicillin-binding protein 2 [Alkaliphilus hydrothermalis]